MDQDLDRRLAYVEERLIILGRGVSALVALAFGAFIYVLIKPSAWAWLAALAAAGFSAWLYIDRPMAKVDELRAKHDMEDI